MLIKRRLWLVVALGLLVIGVFLLSHFQNRLPTRLTLPQTPLLTPILPSTPLTQQNVQHVVELKSLSSEVSDPVAALAFSPDSRELLAVHSTDGVLHRWEIQEGKLIATLDIGPVGLEAISFDAQARLVAAASGKIESTEQRSYVADFNGVRIWDTTSGNLILDTDGGRYNAPKSDAALSSDGKWLADVEGSGVDFYDSATGKSFFGLVITHDSEGQEGEAVISAVALDPVGEWLAYADDHGNVFVHKRENGSFGLPPWILQSRDRSLPLDLAFDPSRRWLAKVSNESLIVWNLQALFSNIALEETISSGPFADLAFSPDGSLLVISNQNGWQIWTVENTKLLAENKQPAYAVTFSPDGRLFAWGDTSGVVHIWGVPGP